MPIFFWTFKQAYAEEERPLNESKEKIVTWIIYLVYHRFGCVSFATGKINQKNSRELKYLVAPPDRRNSWCKNKILKMWDFQWTRNFHEWISHLIGIWGKVRYCLLNCVLHFIPFLLLCIRNLNRNVLVQRSLNSQIIYLLAEFDSSSLENEGIFFAVTQIDVNPWRSLGD